MVALVVNICAECKHCEKTVSPAQTWTTGMWWWKKTLSNEARTHLGCTYGYRDIISGDPDPVYSCNLARRFERYCGIEGRYWEARA